LTSLLPVLGHAFKVVQPKKTEIGGVELHDESNMKANRFSLSDSLWKRVKKMI